MELQELNEKHILTCRYEECGDEGNYKNHTKLSIQFAIDVLEEMYKELEYYCTPVKNKIQELKQYLDGEKSE